VPDSIDSDPERGSSLLLYNAAPFSY